MIRTIFSSFLLIIFSIQISAQQPTQTIRGTVTDNASSVAIPYASIRIQNTGIGSISDSVGNFTLNNVKVGRYNIEVTTVGYEPVVLKEIQVTSGKEVFLNIQMKEQVTSLSEITVKPNVNKEQPINTMATVSAKMLSVEEAQRYAGGFDDLARLVSAFAGVSSNVGNNAIVVRGNNPQSLQWKMEGIEISNPNHFADMSVFGGGGLTALSAQLLANSDFMSGAMPAEYGNALSGVFDIYMRNGNNQKYEHTFQIGLIGIDAASEGPFKKGGKSSYLFNYRYSTLALITPIMPDNAQGTKYQDLSFKLNFPTKKAGVFSLWGIGLSDFSDVEAINNINEWKYDDDRENMTAKQYMGATGLSHKIFLNNRQYLKSTLATTVNGIKTYEEKLDSSFVSFPQKEMNNKYYNVVLSSYINTKFSAKHTNRIGFVYTQMFYDLLLKKANQNGASLQPIVDSNGNSALISAYTSSIINPTNRIVINAGINTEFFTLNNHYSIEPRVGIKYQLASKQSLSFAYGLHSRLERLNYYFIKNNQNELINNDLNFTKAHHFVIGYDLSTSEFTHLKIETYYQHLYSVPVIPDSSFSMINQLNDWYFNDKLENSGKGRNYGVDITFEKYLSQGYYYMATASLFNSQYVGGDNVWRSTKYNRNFAFNFLIGKEWQIGKRKQNVLGLNARANYQGGDHYSPINTALSIQKQYPIFDETQTYSKQISPAFSSHFTATYKINKKKLAHEFSLKIINLNQYADFLGFKYDYQNKTIVEDREVLFFPNLSYKIEF
ncbi:conserved exported hypothetical protein [uncultured Paludibacter sp.]|uniref:TonB-dependent receptor n=1 Tax=uncultured Paludibacter sp. TaxID=497635 RepID=A0A653AKS7_9BACT|nr:conserved exported hypothetical protein [uncultured Paludibacter sp.]